ncbi:Highly reducing polyketide synthase gloL [Metarhizium brunneum]|uniref:Highly reducing polyketide synthase gloL n=1 Tax=Metarhizium brunneum TaxID=500148 RepID=A0A7D5V052_9HYPO
MGSLAATVGNGETNESSLQHPATHGSHTANGHTANGHITNGHTLNGHSINGHTADDNGTINGSLNGLGYPSQTLMAICGMACRLPGGIASAEELWEFLLAKKNARTRVPESRYNVSAFHSAVSKPGTVATEYGHFLDDSVDLGALDTSVFPLNRTELERSDPQQRLMLEVAREAFEDAGVTDWRGKTVGCYIGNYGEDWSEMFAKEPQQYGLHRITGTGDFVIANRLSYEFDIRGPSVTIRTACSSALIGINEACAAIARGDCEAAIVGGLNLILAPAMTISETEQGVLSKDGSCKTFSADANGYARGEAVTAVFIKPLTDAIRDGNPVRAVIRAVTNNSDGKTPGISHPSTSSQETLMRRAYAMAGITDFGETAMVECHGTGTPIGDPIEANAVARVFGERGVYIGSVKPNLGHTEGASGLVSLIKMVKALEHRTIPPQIRFTAPNPNILFKEGKLTVPLEPTPWPQDRLERVSLNSFGVGGSNAHIILESAVMHNAATVIHATPEEPQLLLYTASSAKSLARMIDNYRHWVERNPSKVADLAYTLARKRDHGPHRAFAIANGGAIETVSPPASIKPGTKPPNIVMVFTGQGAQWPQMGRQLWQSNETFKASIQHLDQCLQAVSGERPHYSIQEELKKPAKKSRVSSAEISQPLCTAIQIALVDCLKALGIVPSAVVGHSSGEIAAAYASGALTASEAIMAAHHRGAVTNRQRRKGSMAAIGMSWRDTEKHLVPNVVIACDNSPKSVTISGDTDKVKAVVADIQMTRPEVLARLLQVDKAYHSHHMAEIGDDYASLISGQVNGKGPSNAFFFSSVTGKLLDGEHNLGSAYWRTNLESPVRFREAVTNLLNHEVGKHAVFIEIGPHSALAGPLRQIFTETSSPCPYLSVIIRNQDCLGSYLAAVGKLHSLNVNINLDVLFPTGSCLPDLPRYPWNHENTCWYESRLSKDWRFRKFPYHDLLGLRVVESTELEPAWRNLFHLSNTPWVHDHKIGDDIVFPFAGYIAMAGEAVRQTTGINDGFSIQNVLVSTALVLPKGKPTEMITTFRPKSLTTALNSSWWEFTMASYNGDIWTKHCTGEVMALTSDPRPGQDPEPLPRKVNTAKWYSNMSKGGLDLGPCFQTLATIETSTRPEDNRAIGNVVNGRQGDEANYHIHPTVLDATIQILGAAATNGQMRKTKTWLPTSMDRLSVYRCSSDMVTSVSARLSSNHSVVGGGRCTAGGVVVVEAENIKMSLAADSISNQVPDTHAAARYEWSADIDFMNVGELLIAPAGRSEYLHLLEELGQLCLLSSKRRLYSTSKPVVLAPHMLKYTSWITSASKVVVVNLASVVSNLDNENISARIHALSNRLADTPMSPVSNAIREIWTNMDLLLSGQTLEDILPEETLPSVLKFVHKSIDYGPLIQHLAHSKPNLRILEIGGDRSSSAASGIAEDLTRPDGQVLCSQYTLSSPGFVSSKDQPMLLPNMEYTTLDIGQDPAHQGFEGHQYDLIIASNVIGATRDPQQSLGNIKRLLSPNGRLLIQETCPSSKWATYVLGVLPTWWQGTADGSDEAAVLSPEVWQSKLAAAGLGSIEATVLDAEQPHQLTATIVARHDLPRETAPRRVTVLVDDENGAATRRMLSRLEDDGYAVTSCRLDGSPPVGQDVLSCLDLDKPFFENLSEPRYQLLKDFLLALGGAGVLWITALSQRGCRDPRYAQVLGLARCVRSEMIADFATCEVDSFDNAQSMDMIPRVLAKFENRDDDADDAVKSDFEWAIIDGQVQVGRFHKFALRDELLVSEPAGKASLDIGTPGLVNSLRWVQQPREAELKPGDVEVQVHSVGLNFRDILVALGIVELPVRQFGFEAAGIITRVGKDVDPNQLKVGDRICCLKKQAFGTYIVTPDYSCTHVPDNITFDEAACMIMPYITAIHGLFATARLSRGQTVLIHSACGGVGLAAVQISQMVGAEVYCSVGREDKVEFLMNNFNIPRNRIFYSRDKSFVGDVMRETGGQGMDVILNSLSGELLHATWTCVAEFGTLVEIGKRDLIGRGKLDMEPFLKNRSYCCIDIDRVWSKPWILRKHMLDAFDWCAKGLVTPVRPVKSFPASQTQDAFRYMQKGFHIGRIGISISHNPEHPDTQFETVKMARPITFDGSGSYLLVGGLGGLGRAISVWMAEHGARELIYLSRSAGGDTKHDLFVAELKSMGCNVKLIQGDVTKLEDVEKAVKAATHALRGIIQMSMVLYDQNFTKMTFEEWTGATAPKVEGTWNLHRASLSAGTDLDFFVLFSSVSGIIGQSGQANYASANTFLDAFAQYRKGLGLAASVVDVGAVEDIGVITERQGLMSTMKATGFKGVTEQELLDAMVLAMFAHARPTGQGNSPGFHSAFVEANTFVLGLDSSIPLSSPNNRSVWKRDRRMAVYHNAAAAGAEAAASNDGLKSFLAGARADPSVLSSPETANLFAVEIGKKLFHLLLKPQEDLNIALPLVDLGLDSLVALELKAWWKQVFSFDISVLEMLAMGSLAALGKHAADQMIKITAIDKDAS